MSNGTLRKGYHCAWQIHYHIVFPVKYRKSLLDSEVAEIIKETSEGIAERYSIEMEAIDCDSDHIHLLCGAHPKISPGRIVQIFKSITAREVFRRKPSVKKELWGGEFWSDGYYVATVGERANWDIVESYVQKTRSTQNLPKAVQIVWVNRLLGGYNGDRINSILYSDLKDSLPGDMLTKVDWMSMKNSLEVRVPLLDHRVVEMAFRMKRSLKLNKGKSKYILKETFKDLLPTNLYKRPKAGFEVPISRWLKTDLKFLIDQYLAKEKLREQGIFDFEIVDGLIQKHLSNKTDTSWMLWNLIVFQNWYQNYFL